MSGTIQEQAKVPVPIYITRKDSMEDLGLIMHVLLQPCNRMIAVIAKETVVTVTGIKDMEDQVLMTQVLVIRN